MHNNYFFFRQVSPVLENRLRDAVVSECFSQSKDELVIRFETATEPFFIKVSVAPAFSCLSFPGVFHRARKNSADLFSHLIGQRVMTIRQFKNERSFALLLSNDYSLLFKMHGNRSNIILFRANEAEVLFKNNIHGDSELKLNELDREIDWTREGFIRHQDDLQRLYFTFGKTVWKQLKDQLFYEATAEDQWRDIQLLLQQFSDHQYFICDAGGKIVFTLFPTGKVLRKFQDPLAAVSDFFSTYIQQNALVSEKASAHSYLRASLHASEQYLEKTTEKLNSLHTETNYKVFADLIMANLHALKTGMETVSLSNFYNENQPIVIKLKKELSPQKNAELFYTKSKKQHLEISRLKQALATKETEITQTKERLGTLEKIEDLKTLRTQVDSWGLVHKNERIADVLPYHDIEYHGFHILIGKNALSNDKLTLKYAYKEDLWLHAKDVAGSHVLIKYQSGKKFPKVVIERAAQLAAFYSKRKTDSLCPVVVTPRKFVRKRKGDPAGAVVVEREEVIMVVPLN